MLVTGRIWITGLSRWVKSLVIWCVLDFDDFCHQVTLLAIFFWVNRVVLSRRLVTERTERCCIIRKTLPFILLRVISVDLWVDLQLLLVIVVRGRTGVLLYPVRMLMENFTCDCMPFPRESQPHLRILVVRVI